MQCNCCLTDSPILDVFPGELYRLWEPDEPNILEDYTEPYGNTALTMIPPSLICRACQAAWHCQVCHTIGVDSDLLWPCDHHHCRDCRVPGCDVCIPDEELPL